MLHLLNKVYSLYKKEQRAIIPNSLWKLNLAHLKYSFLAVVGFPSKIILFFNLSSWSYNLKTKVVLQLFYVIVKIQGQDYVKLKLRVFFLFFNCQRA